MNQSVALLLVAVAALLIVALAVAYIYPPTRPYVRKYGWVAVAALFVAVAFPVLLPGQRKRTRTPVGSEGMAASGADAIRQQVEEARANASAADAELAVARAEARKLGTSAQLDDLRARLDAAQKVLGPAERRRRLNELSDATRGLR